MLSSISILTKVNYFCEGNIKGFVILKLLARGIFYTLNRIYEVCNTKFVTLRTKRRKTDVRA